MIVPQGPERIASAAALLAVVALGRAVWMFAQWAVSDESDECAGCLLVVVIVSLAAYAVASAMGIV